MIPCYVNEIESEVMVTEEVFQAIKELGLTVQVIGSC